MHVRLNEFEILMQTYFFDFVILPGALYGCEICGFGNIQIIDNYKLIS